MNPTLFESFDREGMQRLKRAEKQLVEKPYERPVEKVDHDDRRRRFRDIVDKKEKVENKKKSSSKRFEGEDELLPRSRSLFELAGKNDAQLDLDLSTNEENEPVVAIEVEMPKNPSPYYIAPIHLTNSAQEKVEQVGASSRQQEMVQLIEQLASDVRLARMRGSEITQVRVGVRNLSLFKGVSFLVTQSSAKQLSVAFYEVHNPEGRALLESQHAQALLRARLSELGYTLHQVTIEPKLEQEIAIIPVHEASDARHNQDSDDEEESQQF